MGSMAEHHAKARQVYQSEGGVALLRRVFRFLVYCVFEYRTYYLYAEGIDDLRLPSESDVLPKVDDFTLKVVATNREADELDDGGLQLRSYVPHSTRRLDTGAIAFCFFVGRELAHVGWVALTQEAKDALDEPPYRVDFSNGEACAGSIWTNPRHRGRGIRSYNSLKRLEFLRDAGIRTKRAAIAKGNVASQKGRTRLSLPGPHAEARYLRLLWWRSWKERPLAG